MSSSIMNCRADWKCHRRPLRLRHRRDLSVVVRWIEAAKETDRLDMLGKGAVVFAWYRADRFDGDGC